MNELGVITVLLATTQARLTRNGFKEILQNKKDDAAKNEMLNCWNDYTVTMDKLSAVHLPSNQKDYKGMIKLVNEAVKMMKDKKISVYWSSDLPEGILEMISKRLALSDYVSFGNVCKTWRGIVTKAICAKPSRGFPWLLMSGQYETTTRSCFSILENKMWFLQIPKSYGECVLSGGCVMGSFEEWLIMVKFHQCPFKISVINPLSGVEIHLPPVDENYRKLMFSKYPGDENCVYMLFTRLWSKSIFWTLGAQDWCELGADRYYDGISLNGYFYLLYNNNNIRVIDGTNILSTVTTELYEVRMPHDLPIQDDDDISMSSRYLVELCGEIILVYRYLRRKHDFHSSIRFETYDFKICKLDLSKKAWVALDSLGDYVLFVSRNCSRSILAKELGLGMANCIYFTYEYDEPMMNEWEFPQCREGSNQSDWGVFNLEKNHSKSICPIETALNRWPSTWITVPLWWYFQKKTPLFM
ncbi:hypothetical protein Pint_24249 [Pistacia integerrima]|uniref:Uncharacterized protein n=1 Tax=Pistacia integerrima TaxID=434235 RepID=A0ACC0YCM6_9ROSI|nr:hypothetical protein Pint_24249 [Pistacia integerrima]